MALKESKKSKKITLTKADQASLEPAVLSLLQMFLEHLLYKFQTCKFAHPNKDIEFEDEFKAELTAFNKALSNKDMEIHFKKVGKALGYLITADRALKAAAGQAAKVAAFRTKLQI